MIREIKDLEFKASNKEARETRIYNAQLVREQEKGKSETEEAKRKAEELDKKIAAVNSYWTHVRELGSKLETIVDQGSRDRIIAVAAGYERSEEAIRTIVEEVQVDLEEVMGERKVSDVIIEAAVRPFLS